MDDVASQRRDGERGQPHGGLAAVAARVESEYGIVLLFVLAAYVLGSLIGDKGWHAVVLAVIATATGVVALAAAGAQTRGLRIAVALSLLAIAFAAVAAITDDRFWLNIASPLVICLLAVAMVAVLRSVLTAPEIAFNTILGALSFYAVLGILFSYVYETVDRIQTQPFFAGIPTAHGGDFLFFSYTTLTTTGYGDLVPAGEPGQMIAGLEMMMGQIFLVTLVAGLVSLWRPGERLRQRRAKRPSG